MKIYRASFDFYSIDFTIKANNKREANKKAKEKLKKINLSKYINKHCSWVEED